MRITAPRSLRIAATCVLAGAAAVAGVLVLGRSTSAPVIAPGAPLVLATSFDPAVPQFGDRILARVVVAIDTNVIRSQTLVLSDDLAPLTQLGAARTSRSTQGRLELLTAVIPVSCLSAACVARRGVARLGLPVVHVSAMARDGRVVRASAAWPPLAVRGRVTASDLAPTSPPFEADTAPLAATYRIAPATLATLLDVLAVLCALLALALAGWQVTLMRRRLGPQRGALERALRLTREAERRPAPDRRRALALLGRALGRDRRSGEIGRLAWSKPQPEPDEIERLVSDIERGGTG